MVGLRSGLCDFKKRGPSVLGSSGELAFALLHSPDEGNQPRRAPYQRPQTCLVVKETGCGSVGNSKFEETSSCSVRLLLWLVARMSQTRWAAIEQPALKHTLPNLPVTFKRSVPKLVRTARSPLRCARVHPNACLPVMLTMRTVARVQ